MKSILFVLLVTATLLNNGAPARYGQSTLLQELAEIQSLVDKLANIINENNVKFIDDIKFTANNVKWAITSDDAGLTSAISQYIKPTSILYSSNIIFLQEGNSRAGLEHIYERHRIDFVSNVGIGTKQGISDFIEKIISQGNHIQHSIDPYKEGLKIAYKIGNSSNYLHVIISSNGSVITSYINSKPKLEQ